MNDINNTMINVYILGALLLIAFCLLFLVAIKSNKK